MLLYVAPERLLTPRMLAMLEMLDESGRLSLVAIDEAGSTTTRSAFSITA